MAKESISDKATRAYGAARDNRYVQRLVEDEDLRASILAAIASARAVCSIDATSSAKPNMNDRLQRWVAAAVARRSKAARWVI